MKYLLVILLSGVCTSLFGQVHLNLEKCREMALESSKKMAIAAKQGEKAEADWKSYRANFLPKISATGICTRICRRRLRSRLTGGYLPTFVPQLDGTLKPNYLLNPLTNEPLIGPDGNPIFNQYAFMPDIDLELGLRGAYSAGLMLEQPIYMGGKVRSAYRMAVYRQGDGRDQQGV